MIVKLIKSSGNIYDITNAVSKLELSGSASQAARQLSFDYINAPHDDYKLPQVATGDIISFAPENDEVFYGQIFGSEKSTLIGTITFTAYDMMKNLLESTGQYNFKNKTPETIARMVCDDAQFPIRYLYPTGINISSMLCDGMSYYDIIMAAYTKAYRITGEKFFPMIYKRGLGIYKSEWIVKGFTVSAKDNLSEASIEESMQSIVNRVRIYDEKSNQIGEVKDDDSLKLYGTFQQIYKSEKGIEPTTAAKSMLSVRPEQVIKIKCVGDISCLSCYFVTIKDEITGLNGKYWISSDKHTWENGVYTMELELKFEAIMDTKESTKEEKK